MGFNRMNKTKKGQYASNAAAFVAILTVLIILYILFLPPDVRTELLGDKSAIINSTGGGSGTSTMLLQQNVGLVTYVNTDQKSYDLPATRINSPTSGQVIKSVPAITILHALLDSESSTYEVDFNINKDATKNALLSFKVDKYYGPLIITLNGKEIYSKETSESSPKPIALDADTLQDSNTLVFSVPSPGWAFWSVNKYSLENVQITADVTDYSNAQATQYFTISQAEKDNLDSIALYFYPNCDFNNVGPLSIDLNKKTIYSSVADCGTRTFAELNKDYITVGANELKFYSNKGSYTLDNMYVNLNMKTPAYPSYFFEMKDNYFVDQNQQPNCGDYDGVCPAGCTEAQDADCCFQGNGYWCALPTLNANDRCLFTVSANNCGICKTGYYDSSGDAPKNCQGLPGDNNDNVCLSSTTQPSRYYDKDCCFAASPDNFWCKETPITGISDKCRANIDPSQCGLCPSGYVNNNGAAPDSCTNLQNNKFVDNPYAVLDQYEVKLTVRFVDSTTRKRVNLNINGHTFTIDTPDIEYTKNINTYVVKGTNSIEIMPVNDDITIAELKVEIVQN